MFFSGFVTSTAGSFENVSLGSFAVFPTKTARATIAPVHSSRSPDPGQSPTPQRNVARRLGRPRTGRRGAHAVGNSRRPIVKEGLQLFGASEGARLARSGTADRGTRAPIRDLLRVGRSLKRGMAEQRHALPICRACDAFSRSPFWLSSPRQRRSPGRPSETAQANGQGCGAGANGSAGIRVCGPSGRRASPTGSATSSPRPPPPTVISGHVAGWIGVGGPDQGANGQTLWLQVGVASIPDMLTMVYAEITRGGQDPVFVPLVQNVQVGESHKVAVLEMSGRPNWWRLWLDVSSRLIPWAAAELDETVVPHRDRRVVERRPGGMQLVRLPLRRRRRRRGDRPVRGTRSPPASSSRIAASTSSA